MSQTITGGRVKMYVNGILTGIFESCNYSMSYGTEAIHTLGAFAAQEIAITSAEMVTVTCSGFRVFNQGPHAQGAVPKLSDLLNYAGVQLQITDRQNPSKAVLVVQNCVPTSYNGSHSSRATSKISITYQGIVATDETADKNAESGSSSFPGGSNPAS